MGDKLVLIGVTSYYNWVEGLIQLRDRYLRKILNEGASVLIIPPFFSDEIADSLDGLVLSGGDDVDPRFYGELPRDVGSIEPIRDETEIKLIREFRRRDKPVMGICRGAQVINVSMGGTLIQDIKTEVSGAIKHWWSRRESEVPYWHPTHRVRIDRDSMLFNIIGNEVIWVNSFHHQAIKRVGSGLKAVAWSDDGIIEAVEAEKGFLLGIQWHPEGMEDEPSRRIFKSFVEACKK
ncbi:MAG: gamma-glutamyl-gamma-aminobutyrate hydrolase family protein [Candidatus Methanodesulfokora sp.]